MEAMPAELICLKCEHQWLPRKADERLKLNWRQCGVCRSYDNITLSERDAMIRMVKDRVEQGELPLVAALEVVVKETKEKSYRFRPVSTIHLVRMIREGAIKK